MKVLIERCRILTCADEQVNVNKYITLKINSHLVLILLYYGQFTIIMGIYIYIYIYNACTTTIIIQLYSYYKSSGLTIATGTPVYGLRDAKFH